MATTLLAFRYPLKGYFGKYLLALLLLLAYTSQAEPYYPILSKTEADSLRSRLKRSAPDTNRVKLLVQLSHDLTSLTYYFDKSDSIVAYIHQAQALSNSLHYVAGQIDADYALGYLLRKDPGGREAVLQALARSQQRHDRRREAIGWYLLSETYEKSMTLHPQRIRYLKQAIRLFGEVHDPVQQARVLRELADAYLMQGKPARAKEELLRSLALYRAAGYRKQHSTLDLLAATNDALGNYKDALQYAMAAVASAKRSQDTLMLCTYYMRVGAVYHQFDQREKIIQYYRLAMRSAEANHYTDTALSLASTIARVLLAENRPQEALALILEKSKAYPPQDDYSRLAVAQGLISCYLRTKQYALATAYCQQVESLLRSKNVVDNTRVLHGAYLTIGACCLATKQYSKARTYLLKSLAAGQVVLTRSSMAHACLLLSRVDSAQGKLPSALAYYQRYKAINDSIFNEKNSKQLAALQVQYDTEKREQSIALLTKQTQLQQLTIRQRELQRNAVLGGAGLLVLVLGLGYNRYRLKQRSARLLEQKQLALETQQAEIHRKNHALEQVVSEKDQLLEERQGLLVEKDWMLKEIHHRVKNNLQVVSSLLSTQSRHLHDPQAVAAIRESQNRVQVMALLHQKLYQADNLGRVNLADYARDIVTYLVESFDRQRSVLVQLELAPIELETTVATPLGLIINEAVTNALKHAFPSSRRGTLTVRLRSLAPSFYELTISDDGVGLPPGFDLKRSRSLGMVIIKGLSRQLDGQLAVSSADGVCLNLQFDTRKKPVPAEAIV
ncbi:histidine kinase dimerization/phosphoacceptor domain -containing protein [Hymenobacter sp. YC55]|uniref:histidine kinase dimerization/phosphoacceptor domain -containing protein n=1 Tax=Hymenobacter sp. YC55 TaxID=3034019 RepID=UPI0023F6231F|nr:histidine kinase dimerization/phosphoacceptor domain -containing protein [Hymenobacter sp. YC55]MDF7814068.1 histidine kinase dimerization/phosphoacceptor domain -containing protein [Hymenobacter sp. YC55]